MGLGQLRVANSERDNSEWSTQRRDNSEWGKLRVRTTQRQKFFYKFLFVYFIILIYRIEL